MIFTLGSELLDLLFGLLSLDRLLPAGHTAVSFSSKQGGGITFTTFNSDKLKSVPRVVHRSFFSCCFDDCDITWR